jgi:hypothetical protein
MDLNNKLTESVQMGDFYQSYLPMIYKLWMDHLLMLLAKAHIQRQQNTV